MFLGLGIIFFCDIRREAYMSDDKGYDKLWGKRDW
jgi:hypothetical protein